MTSTTDTQPYVGRGVLNEKAALALGCDYLPDCDHVWRTAGALAAEIASYGVGLEETFSQSQLFALAGLGDALIRQSGGLYAALMGVQGLEMRSYADQLAFAHENNDLFHAQYHAVIDIPNHGVRAVYDKGVGITPRIRGIPYSLSKPDQTFLIASKLRKDIHAQRIFVCSTDTIASDTPIEAKPAKTVEKKNPGRTISTDRRAIADMRRIDVGLPSAQYYPVRGPSVEAISRLLVPATVSFPCLDVQMAKRDIASAFSLLRIHPALSLLMRTELPGGLLGYSRDIVFIYLVMPFGRNGAPANCAIFGDSITGIHGKFGMERPDWFLPTPFLSKLYVGDGVLFEIRKLTRQGTNETLRGHIAVGLLGRNSLNWPKLEEGGKWKETQTMLGFDIDAHPMTISIPDAKISGSRVLFDNLNESQGSMEIEAVTPQQVRGHVEHFKASTATAGFLT